MMYEDSLLLKEKIAAVVREIYNGDGVDFTPAASRELDKLEALGFGHLPVCWGQNPVFPVRQSRPAGLAVRVPVTVRGVRLAAGAGFVVVLTGDIMTMPGLPKVPAAEAIDVDENGKISGLF